ncbi:hypothetical protein ACFWC9_38405 [Streptomyces goshikiensis]|uniref:hypothetical protein n=1 Tax=Streptomyces goshikiensis TaxID=1942 RepID=UPI0036D0734D
MASEGVQAGWIDSVAGGPSRRQERRPVVKGCFGDEVGEVFVTPRGGVDREQAPPGREVVAVPVMGDRRPVEAGMVDGLRRAGAGQAGGEVIGIGVKEEVRIDKEFVDSGSTGEDGVPGSVTLQVRLGSCPVRTSRRFWEDDLPDGR